MDFMEGFLLGPIWSDTEYETSRHTGFYWLLGWLICFAWGWLVAFPAKTPEWVNMPRFFPVLIFSIFALASPFACRYYYGLNVFLKFGILIFQILKFGFGILAFIQFWLPRIDLDLDTLPQKVLEYVNKTVAMTTDYFEGLGKGFGMLVGIASGGLLIVLTFAAGLFVATVAPALYLVALKMIQRGIDLLARRTLIKELD